MLAAPFEPWHVRRAVVVGDDAPTVAALAQQGENAFVERAAIDPFLIDRFAVIDLFPVAALPLKKPIRFAREKRLHRRS